MGIDASNANSTLARLKRAVTGMNLRARVSLGVKKGISGLGSAINGVGSAVGGAIGAYGG